MIAVLSLPPSFHSFVPDMGWLGRGFGIRPNVVSFNSAISACAKASWQHALALFTAMPLEEAAAMCSRRCFNGPSGEW